MLGSAMPDDIGESQNLPESRQSHIVNVKVGFYVGVCSMKEAWWHTTERNPIP
jgi:hypothetical protein